MKEVKVCWIPKGYSELIEDLRTDEIYLKINIFLPKRVIHKQINKAKEKLLKRFEQVELLFEEEMRNDITSK